MRTLSFPALLTLAACTTSASDTGTDETSDTEGTSDTDETNNTDDTDVDDTDDTDTTVDTDMDDTDGEVPTNFVPNGGFEDPSLGSDGAYTESPTMPGWEPAPFLNTWGFATLLRSGGAQFMQLWVVCTQCVGQSLSDGVASLRTTDLGTAMAGKTCQISAGAAPGPSTLYDENFAVQLTAFYDGVSIASNEFAIPTTGTNLTISADVPDSGTDGLVVEVALVQRVALPSGSATATGAKLFLDNVAVYCQ